MYLGIFKNHLFSLIYKSSIPFAIKHDCVEGEIIRISRGCSKIGDFKLEIDKLIVILKRNRFPRRVIRDLYRKTIDLKTHNFIKYFPTLNQKEITKRLSKLIKIS